MGIRQGELGIRQGELGIRQAESARKSELIPFEQQRIQSQDELTRQQIAESQSRVQHTEFLEGQESADAEKDVRVMREAANQVSLLFPELAQRFDLRTAEQFEALGLTIKTLIGGGVALRDIDRFVAERDSRLPEQRVTTEALP